MEKFPNMWKDEDEFSIARRTKFHDQLMRSIEERKKDRPEPKEPQPEPDEYPNLDGPGRP